jgi:hypothetical protein
LAGDLVRRDFLALLHDDDETGTLENPFLKALVVGFTSPCASAPVFTRKQRHQQKLAGIPRCALVEMG